MLPIRPHADIVGSSLLDAYLVFKTGSLYKRYAQANPGESARIDVYWNGGAETTAATATGRGLLGWARAHRRLNP